MAIIRGRGLFVLLALAAGCGAGGSSQSDAAGSAEMSDGSTGGNAGTAGSAAGSGGTAGTAGTAGTGGTAGRGGQGGQGGGSTPVVDSGAGDRGTFDGPATTPDARGDAGSRVADAAARDSAAANRDAAVGVDVPATVPKDAAVDAAVVSVDAPVTPEPDAPPPPPEPDAPVAGPDAPPAPEPDAPMPEPDSAPPEPDAPTAQQPDAAVPDIAAPPPDLAPPAPDTAAPACPTLPALKLTRVGDGFDQPVYVTGAPGDATRLYVVEKKGFIRVLHADGSVPATPFLDVSAQLNIPSDQAEGGLLGLAFSPDYATSGRFFIHHSVKATSTLPERVSILEFKRSAGNPEVADAAAVQEVLWVKHSAWNHVGGMIAFGKDGYLYIAVGDGAGQPSDAPNLASRLGKILRVDVNNPQTAPAGNLVMTGADPYIWDWGLRNPWRFSVDRGTGNIYIGDVGQKTKEEIDVEAAGSGLRDYGWDKMEGDVCYPIGSSCTPSGTPPAVVWGRADVGTIIGGFVYRGSNIPCLQGRYIYTDFETSRIFSFVWNGSAATNPIELSDDLNPSAGIAQKIASFGEDTAGEMYLVTFATGRVYRIDLE